MGCDRAQRAARALRSFSEQCSGPPALRHAPSRIQVDTTLSSAIGILLQNIAHIACSVELVARLLAARSVAHLPTSRYSGVRVCTLETEPKLCRAQAMQVCMALCDFCAFDHQSREVLFSVVTVMLS